jgi:hypothetical protein
MDCISGSSRQGVHLVHAAKLQRAGAVQDAVRLYRPHGERGIVLDCGGPPPLLPKTGLSGPKLTELCYPVPEGALKR